MESFPSQTELIVAEALLLLLYSQTPYPNPNPKLILPQISSTCSVVDRSFLNQKEDSSSSPTDSKSCCSTVTTGDSKEVDLAVVVRPQLKGGTKEDSCVSVSESKSSSTITSEVSSSGIGKVDRIRSSAAELSSLMLIKVVRKSRSQTQQKPNPLENMSGSWSNSEMPVKEGETDDVLLSNEEESTDESSLSNASSAEDVAFEATSRKIPKARKKSSNIAKSKRQKTGANYLVRRADLILQFLAGGCASEARIRQVISDSPDTSKALRMLLKMNKIERFGKGGVKDPFIYMIAEEGSYVASD